MKMSLEQDRSEVLSSRAAAFSIANLLNDDSKKLSSETQFHSTRNQVNLDQPASSKRYARTSLYQQKDFISSQQSYQPFSQEKRGKQDSYAIRNLLENAQAKINEHEDFSTTRHHTNINTPERENPLHQLTNCYDFVRNFDFLRSDLIYKDIPRMPLGPREIQVALQQSELWWKFYSCGTEMVITRTGRSSKQFLIIFLFSFHRRMFPTLSLSFFGMDPKKYYSIHVDLVTVDRYNYTFVNNAWQVNAIASEVHPSSYIQSYQADEIVHTGIYWMKNGVDFKKIRLTNRRTGSFKEGELQLSPNRKYQPRIHVVEETDDGTKVSCSTYVFPETSFIAVTTYQNEELIQMKIDHNPFAKGFRDKGARRRFVPYDQRPASQPMEPSSMRSSEVL
ncbi:T-box transcription factor tbx-9-like [Actinia tenebrosa]|uniref:T-box transcription factor tbx-9-like n=1 Tax=Actinia tenebrosa TaxID=6105 RepID=A0A6P8ITF8_ACTTE|nr:T-box transcription factor tbx-9-like [Actinia tenebrosa]